MMLSAPSVSVSAALRSSITANSGGTPASSGKRRSNDWQKAWIVAILAPPGISSTRTNSWRARAVSCSCGKWPVSSTSCSASAPGGRVAQAASRSLTRFAISAAAARVKVRNRMRAGSVPSSISANSRSVSTLVLPVPAEADTHTDTSGPSACRCTAAASAARVIALILFFFEPFEMAVVGITRRPSQHRHRQIRRRRVVEARDEPADPGQHPIDQIAGILGPERLPLAGRLAAGQTPVFERRRLAGHAVEAAGAGDRAFQRQLHRDAKLDLGLRRQYPGLVIEDRDIARAQAIDPVGDRGHRERPARRRDHEPAVLLAEALGDVVAPQHLLGDEPAGDPLEARPPEGPRPRPRQVCTERATRDVDQFAFRIGRQIARILLDEKGERLVHRNAELGPPGI